MRAQITELGSAQGRLLVVRSLPTAGVKLFRTDQSGITLYNLDMSTYATIPYPPLPTGYTYFDVLYFTESTFDTDPLSIELMMLTQDTDFVSGTRVFRDDGTILLDELGLGFSGRAGYSELNGKPPLFTDENGLTYMVLCGVETAPTVISKLYQLPGTLPCMDCAGEIGLGLQPMGTATDEGQLALFPNPATDEVTVTYSLPSGNATGRLVMNDALGRLVINVPLDPSGHMVLQLAGHGSGAYACSLVIGGHIVRTRQLMLTH